MKDEDSIPCKINPGEHYFTEEQFRRIALLLGKSEEEIKKELALLEKVSMQCF